MSSIRSLAALSASVTMLCAVPSAIAQQPAPAAAAVVVPPMNCENPGAVPIGPQGPAMTRFQKKVDDYKICVNQYVAATGAKSNEFNEQARVYRDAANKAIDDYNAYVTKLNEATKTDSGAAPKK